MSYPTFLINLEQHKQRRAFMEAQFAALGLPLVRIDAALGADPKVRANAAVASYAALTDGEVGCFESHRRFWQSVVDQNLPGAVVIEDDVVVASDFDELVFPDDVLADADVIKIDQGVRNVGQYGTRKVALSETRSLIRLLGTEFSTGCYFVTNAGARKLLTLSKSYFLPVDRFMFAQETKAFWDLKVWKLDTSAAVQFRLLDPEGEAETEMADSISANRVSGKDKPRGVSFLKQNALRLRRLLDWDMRAIRENRKSRNLANFAKDEPIESRSIAFSSPNQEHVVHAKTLLT